MITLHILHNMKLKLSVYKLLSDLKIKTSYAVLIIFFSTNVSAAGEVVSQADPMSGTYLLQLILGLIVVVFLILVLAWFARKMNRFQSTTDESLQIIGGISMGARERIVLLQVGEEQILVGVVPGRLNKLHVLDKPIEKSTDTPANSMGKNFSDKLKVMMSDADKSSATKKNKQ